MTVPDFSIKYLQKHTEYDKDENLTYHQKVRIIDQLPPKDKRIYFPNKEDRAEIRTLKSYPCCVSWNRRGPLKFLKIARKIKIKRIKIIEYLL